MYLTLESELMPVAKEIKCITGVCCRARSENIAHLWQKIALKTASAWSVWNPCLTVSIAKAFMFLFLLEKDFIYFEINPRLPKCAVCFQAQHMRAVHRGHIVEGLGERMLFRSWARAAKEPACDQPQGSRGAAVLDWYSVCYFCKDFEREDIWAGQSYCSTGPRAMGAMCLVHQRTSCQAVPGTRDHRVGEKLKHSPAQVVLCCGGWLQGWNRMRESQPEQVKPNRALFCMGLVWFACRRQDFRACIRREGRIVCRWCRLAFKPNWVLIVPSEDLSLDVFIGVDRYRALVH